MADSQQHHATLRELNRNYIRAVAEADVAWFDANLAADFCNTNQYFSAQNEIGRNDRQQISSAVPARLIATILTISLFDTRS